MTMNLIHTLWMTKNKIINLTPRPKAKNKKITKKKKRQTMINLTKTKRFYCHLKLKRTYSTTMIPKKNKNRTVMKTVFLILTQTERRKGMKMRLR